MKILKIIILFLIISISQKTLAQDSTDFLVGKWKITNPDRDLFEVIKGTQSYILISKNDNIYTLNSFNTKKKDSSIFNSQNINFKITNIDGLKYKAKIIGSNIDGKELEFRVKKDRNKMKLIFYFMWHRFVKKCIKIE